MLAHRLHLVLFALFVLLTSTHMVEAGGGPQNVLVVVNNLSIESLELGQYYQEARGIPERNICHVSVASHLENISATDFDTDVKQVIDGHINSNGLASQIDYIVLCKDIPTRISTNEGSTAVLFYGYKAASFNPPCNYPTNAANHYHQMEQAFSHQDPYGGTNYYLAMHLTAQTLAQAKSNVDHGVAADYSHPDSSVYVCKTTDAERNIRYKLFDNVDFGYRFFPSFPRYQYRSAPTFCTNAIGILSGAPSHGDGVFKSNQYLPGAMADHFTSYGGYLPTPPLAQSPITKWIWAGASASYGTVNEPCAFLEKFPDPLSYFWYARGFSLAESYWMSVEIPYQGLFIGEPLASPFARPPEVSITNIVSADVVSGVVTVQTRAVGGSTNEIPAKTDLFIDGLFHTNMESTMPDSGNVLWASINNVTCNYTVVGGDSLYDAVAGLAYNVNASNLAVWAYAYGDRLQLVDTNIGYVGTGIVYGVGTEIGGGSTLTISGEALSTNFLPCTYPAREYLQLRGIAKTGDTATCTITLTNGFVVTNRVVAWQSENSPSVMSRLLGLINSNATLQSTSGVYATNYRSSSGGSTFSEISLDARAPGSEGAQIYVDYSVVRAAPPTSGLDPSDSFSDYMNDNQDVLTARGNCLFACGMNPLDSSYALDTTALPDGPHEIRVVAYGGTAVGAQAYDVVNVVVSNSPFSCAVTSPTNATRVELGDTVNCTATASAATQIVFYVEQKYFSKHLSSPANTTWNTTNYGVGEVTLYAHAWNASGQSAISTAITVYVDMSPTIDTDGDDISDLWEQSKFGGLEVYGNADNPDSDGATNYQEYIADTDPNDANNYFLIGMLWQTDQVVAVSFDSSTARVYEAQYSQGFFTNGNEWVVASPTPFAGTGSNQTWSDDGSETGEHPSSVVHRAYRMLVELP